MTAGLRWREPQQVPPPPPARGRGALPFGAVARRLRRDAALAGAVVLVLTVVAVVAALLPGRIAATLDEDLRLAVATAPGPARRLDLLQPGRIPAGPPGDEFARVREVEEQVLGQLEPSVVEVLGSPTTLVRSVQLAAPLMPGRVRLVTLRLEPDAEDRLQVVAGRPPGVSATPGVIEVALSQATAEELIVAVGDTLPLDASPNDPYVRAGFGGAPGDAAPLLQMEVVGLVAAEEDDPYFAEDPDLVQPSVTIDPGGGTRTVRAWALVGTAAFADFRAAVTPNPTLVEWRYPVAAERLDAGAIAGLRTALAAQAQRFSSAAFVPLGDTRLSGGLDNLLAQAEARASAAAGLAASALAAVAGVALTVLLAVGLVRAESRRTEVGLLRARGAGGRALLLADGQEAALLGVVPLLAAVAAALAGRSGLTGVVAGGLTALIGAAVLLVAGAPGATVPHRRAAARRTVVQVAFAVLAAGAAGALLRRGDAVSPDPLAAAAPVLLAIAAGLVLGRAVPPALRLASPLAGRTRGLVAGVTLRAIARRPGVSLGVVAVLVATASATQLAAVSGSGERARTGLAWDLVGADVLVESPGADALADGLPGVTASARAALIPEATVGVAALGIETGISTVLALETRSYQAVIAGSPVDGAVPAALAAATGERVPAIASVTAVGRRQLAVGDELEAAGVPITVAAVVDAFPSLPEEAPFLVVPLPAWAAAGGDGTVDRAYLRSDDAAGTGAAVADADADAEVTTIASARAGLTGTPLARGTDLGVKLASILSAAFAALAVAVTAARAVRGRRGEVAPLLAIGAAPSEVVAVLAAELVAGVAIGAGAGLVVGVATIRLLAGGIDLGVLAGSEAVTLEVQPLVGLALGGFLAALAGIAAAAVGGRQRRDLTAALRTEGHT